VLVLFDQGEPMTEHRLYLASCGFFIALGSVLGSGADSLGGGEFVGGDTLRPYTARAAQAAFLAILVALGGQTVARNRVWANPVDLWRESVALAPDHPRPRLLLGEALADDGQIDAAIQQYQMAIRLRPTDSTGYVKLGRLLAGAGRLADARTELARAVAVDPENVLAQQSLAAVGAAAAAGPHADIARR
jgi:tetratricopeptide (TPR) repeat protein